MEIEGSGRSASDSEEYLRAHTIGELNPLPALLIIVDYDPDWPRLFRDEADKIRSAMGERSLRIEHVGSTSVPGLAAKPIIDIVLLVSDSAVEESYAGDLEKAGYQLQIREPKWYEHRMFKSNQNSVNLHVFSRGCPEVDRMLAFRDWLRTNLSDRDLYAQCKRALVQQHWKFTQNYADAKTAVIEQILARARTAAIPNTPES